MCKVEQAKRLKPLQDIGGGDQHEHDGPLLPNHDKSYQHPDVLRDESKVHALAPTPMSMSQGTPL